LFIHIHLLLLRPLKNLNFLRVNESHSEGCGFFIGCDVYTACNYD